MILLEVLCGIIVAGAIARYNESNKLFWILFTSFVLGIAGQTVYEIATESHDSDSKTLVQNAPTQSLPVVFATNAVTVNDTAHPELTLISVIKEHFGNNKSFAVSECYVETHTKPPITCNLKKACLHISTHLDS